MNTLKCLESSRKADVSCSNTKLPYANLRFIREHLMSDRLHIVLCFYV